MSDVIASWSGRRILVVGDLMLDEHVRGRADRISPEAPVPVVTVDHVSFTAGGAANVALNVTHLGGHAKLVGLLGQDEDGDRLSNALAGHDIETSGLIRDPDRPTTRKTRIVARNQQVVRVDREVTTDPDAQLRARLVGAATVDLDGVEAVVLSDYAKGVLHPDVCQSLILAARERGIPVVVDPKGTDFHKYAGCSVITPNESEAARATATQITDDASLATAAGLIFDSTRANAVIVTRGASGMRLFLEDRVHTLPAEAREVYDVTGAGDTAVGTLALALAAGLDLVEAARWATRAAGVVVAKLGTAQITAAELAERGR